MAEDEEVPVENAPKAETISNKNIGTEEEYKQEVCINETESSMIEDETMPTYLSITSNVSSLKPDDSKVQSVTYAPATDEEEVRSVYEVSSDDDGQNNTEEFYTRRNNNDDDDDEEEEEEYYDDSEGSHVNERIERMRYDQSDDDIDDEEEIVEGDEEDEESDGDIEPELFERSSDDYVLRTSSSSTEKLCKERSKSLQDLSSPKKLSRSNSKRHDFIHPEYYHFQSHSFNHNDSKQSLLPQSKYNHITSKVKSYIQDIKQQNKRLTHRKSIDKDNLNSYTMSNYESDGKPEFDNLKLNPQCHRVKNYVEYEMKNMVDDSLGGQSTNINSQITAVNGNEIKSTDVVKDDEEVKSVNQSMEVDNGNNQTNKSNDATHYSINNTKFELVQEENGTALQRKSLMNGQETSEMVLDIQTLTYDDYMKQNVDNVNKPEKILSEDVTKHVNNVTVNPANLISITPIEMKNIVPKERQLQNENNNINESNKSRNELAKLHRIKNSTECIEKEDYQKIVTENSELRKERDELKRILANIRNEIKRKEVKIAAVQTDEQPLMKDSSTATHLQLPNKLSTSTAPDTGSTLSSVEHWTDSDGSPTVSLKPPNVEHLLESDNSVLQSSSRNSSRALWTTNRILQTLANITPSKPIRNMTEKKFDIQGQSKDVISPLISGGQYPRKRKASDNLGASALGPLPSKISLTNIPDACRKFNSASDTDGATNSTGLSHDAPATAGISQPRNIQSEQQHQGIEETEADDVKCFVWHEDENSQERSCLIQAPIGFGDSLKSKEMRKSVRECGPYLLGNLEVRISEANGTLNIWGKEVSQESNLEESGINEKKQNETIKDFENFWPKTPRTMADNRFKCSTSKKTKTPASVRATMTRHLRDSINRTPSPINESVQGALDTMPNSCQHTVNNRNQSHCHKHSIAPTCNSLINSQTKFSCCTCKPEVDARDHNCRREHELKTNDVRCHCEIAHHRIFSSNLNYHCSNFAPTHFCISQFDNEEDCKHAPCYQLCDNNQEDCCKHLTKTRCQPTGMNNCNHRTENNCVQDSNVQKMKVNVCNNHDSTEEVDPAINIEHSHEAFDKRSRICGKRVRNIIDFLKDCSKCQHIETSSINNCQIPEAETINTRSIPSNQVTSKLSSMTSCSKHPYSFENQKKSNSWMKHAGKTAELEAELEIMQVEITKLHTRSNAMREMIQRVLQTDLNETN